MALFRRLFYRKPPDRLLEITERVYVFDCCFSTKILEEEDYRDYMGGIVAQLQNYFPEASFMVFNFREGDRRSQVSDILSDYNMTVMDYPRQYEGCPLLPLEMIHHFLRSSESWLSMEGQHNVLLMHCEKGGWPVLAFMLAGLLLYRKQYTGEQKTLEMVYKQAPKELLHLLSPLNPQPSHMRYLQYISRRGSGTDWPPRDTPFALECLILTVIPIFDGEGGCRPIVRIYGQNPLTPTNRSPKLLYATPMTKKYLRHYKQAESTPVKINCHCRVQGDVVVEFIHMDRDLECEVMMFRIMFNTAFVQSNVLTLNRDEIDVVWNAKDQFPKNFKAEVLFSDYDAVESDSTIEVIADDGDETEGASTEATEEFFEAEEIFSSADWQDGKRDLDTQTTRIKSSADDGSHKTDIYYFSDEARSRSEIRLEMGNSKEDLKTIVTEKSTTMNDKIVNLGIPCMAGPAESRLGTSNAKDGHATEKSFFLDNMIVVEDKNMLESNSILQDTKGIDFSVVEEKTTLEISNSKEDTEGIITFVRSTTDDLIWKSESPTVVYERSETKDTRPCVYDIITRKQSTPSDKSPNPVTFGMADERRHNSVTHNNKIGIHTDAIQDEAKLYHEGRLKNLGMAGQTETVLDDANASCDHKILNKKLATFDYTITYEEKNVVEVSNFKHEVKDTATLAVEEKRTSRSCNFEEDADSIVTQKTMSCPNLPVPTCNFENIYTAGLSQPSCHHQLLPPSQLQAAPLPPPSSSTKSNSFSICTSFTLSPPPPLSLPNGANPLAPPYTSPPPSCPPPSSSVSSSFGSSYTFRHPPPTSPSRIGVTFSAPPTLLPLPHSPLVFSASASNIPPSPPPPPPFYSNASIKGKPPTPFPPPPPPPPPLVPSRESGWGPPAPPPAPMFLRASIKVPTAPSPPPPLMLSGASIRGSPPPPPPLPNQGVQFKSPPPPPLPPIQPNVGASFVPAPPPPPPLKIGAPPPPRPSPTSNITKLLGAAAPTLPPRPPPMNGGPPPPPPPPGASRIQPPPPPPGACGAPHPTPPFGGRGEPQPPPLEEQGGAPPPPSPSGACRLDPPAPPRAPGAPPPPPTGAPGSQVSIRGLSSNSVAGGRGRGLARPAVSGFSALAPRRSSLKPLHWVKVTRAMQGSLWAELQKYDDGPSASEFDVSELESLFSAVIPKSDDSSKSEGRRKSLGSKSDKVHLIELRRAYNTEIMLTKVKMPLSDLVNAALALDDSILDVDQVENLIKFCPTKEEMELLKGYTGDKEKLGKCEQFFLELMKVPRVESKLRVFSFKIQFGSQVSDLRKILHTIDSSCEQIRGSVKLKEIMKKILLLGNTLNKGTARGSAIGFRLDSLLKLIDTRAANNKMTLMHYLCKVLATRSPHLLDFHEDLVSLEAASKLQLKLLAEEMQAIVKGIEKVELELNASENDGPVSEVFCKTLKEFTSVTGAEVRSLTALYTAVGRNADALALYFGEDPARCPFEQVMSTLLNFVSMFRRAHQENCKQAELEKKRAQKVAEIEKSKASNRMSKNATSLSQQLQQTMEKRKAINQREKDRS